MKRMLFLMALLLLLPVSALAVTEGRVEAAPQVDVALDGMTDALFGAWEQGLADIRASAARAAAAWKPGASELALEEIILRNSPMDKEPGNDQLTVCFCYVTQERKAARLSVEYERGTGRVTGISDTLYGGGGQHGGAALDDAQLEWIALHNLAAHYGVRTTVLCEGDDGQNEYRWIARFDAEGGVFEVCLDRQTGELIRVSQTMKEETK